MAIEKQELLLLKKSKKQRILFAVLIVFELVLGGSYVFNLFRLDLLMPILSRENVTIFVLLVQALFLLWVMEFDVRFRELPFFILPSLVYVAASISILSGMSQLFLILALWAVLGFGYYILIAATNIINVSTVRPVPLKKAALSSMFFVGMVVLFLYGWRIFYVGGAFAPQVWLWVMIVAYGMGFLFMASDESEFRFVETLVYGWLSLQLMVLVNLWPSSAIISALVLTGLCFIVLGVLYQHINRSLNVTMKREYLLFGILLLGVFLWVK